MGAIFCVKMWAMSTIVDAIYEHGIFRPISGVPVMLKEHERVRITIEADDEVALSAEFAQWDAASVEDMKGIEIKLSYPN